MKLWKPRKTNSNNSGPTDSQVLYSLLIISVIGLGGGKLLEVMHGAPPTDTRDLSQTAASNMPLDVLVAAMSLGPTSLKHKKPIF